ncbi:hypothetical protein GCK72_002729 [Caenorhabditis remanei]|uniref:Uncharacterized protein n=1 Tax=Caenorhabditis remanei TaxID=31234 RepID=A0A6A5HTL1_CAERE|nr:hypothetical protein GCK72_002729 [Caenorhabditis remanei]KAF1770905.1 hypothetical protein GCK72_002729 [Caenorhabditis remanei]
MKAEELVPFPPSAGASGAAASLFDPASAAAPTVANKARARKRMVVLRIMVYPNSVEDFSDLRHGAG